MIEIAAKALQEEDTERGTYYGIDDFEAERFVKAVLRSIRNPTDKMLYRADGLTDLVGPYAEDNTPEERRREFACAWAAMIDAALEDGE